MSKVIAWFEGGNILKGDCGHFFETDVQVDTGAEVDCPVCAEKAKDVKAARMEGMESAVKAIQARQATARVYPDEDFSLGCARGLVHAMTSINELIEATK